MGDGCCLDLIKLCVPNDRIAYGIHSDGHTHYVATGEASESGEAGGDFGEAAAGHEAWYPKVTRVVPVRVLAMSNCTNISHTGQDTGSMPGHPDYGSNISTYGYTVETCMTMHIEFDTTSQPAAKYKLFVVNLPLKTHTKTNATCCNCLQRNTTTIDIVPRAEVANTAPTAICQGSTHELNLKGGFFIKAAGAPPTVSLGRVADTWGAFLLPADIPSPAAVSKYGRGIQNETVGVSHVIAGRVNSMSGCTVINTSHVPMEVCDAMKVTFDANGQFASQYEVFVVNLAVDDCTARTCAVKSCDCIQRTTTKIDIVPRVEISTVEPIAVCEGATHDVAVAGRFFMTSDGNPPQVMLEHLASNWTGATFDTWNRTVATTVTPTGCSDVTMSHLTSQVCTGVSIKFSTAGVDVGQYRVAARNLPIVGGSGYGGASYNDCCACREKVPGQIDIVPRADVVDVFPPAICIEAAHTVSITGQNFITTNGAPPVVVFRPVAAAWKENGGGTAPSSPIFSCFLTTFPLIWGSFSHQVGYSIHVR